jgi:hypothetical protein
MFYKNSNGMKVVPENFAIQPSRENFSMHGSSSSFPTWLIILIIVLLILIAIGLIWYALKKKKKMTQSFGYRFF